MRIDEQLYLVLPVEREDGSTIWVHAQPIGRETFDRFWLVLSKAFARMYGEGLGVVTGPRIASRMLRMVAEETGVWEGPRGVRAGLLGEIHRLANVVAPGTNGSSGSHHFIPYEDALKQQMIDEEDADLIEGALVFFTIVWRLHARSDRRAILTGGVALWGAQISSLPLSEFAGSLTTSTATANTGATSPEASSPPFSTGPAMPGSNTSSGNAPPTSPGGLRMNTVSAS